LVDFALFKKSIKGIVFQPTFYSGRHPDVDPLNVVTLPEVIKCIANYSKHSLKDSDFVPTPCCFPTCNSSCYLYIDDNDDDDGMEVKPLARLVKIEDYIDYFTNRSVGDLGQIKESIKVLNSFGCCSGGPENGLDCSNSSQSNSSQSNSSQSNSDYGDSVISNNCYGIPLDLKGIEKNIKVIMVQSFMDPFNFDIKRLMKCCIHEITPQGKIVPICAFNNIPMYREDVSAYYHNKRRGKKDECDIQQQPSSYN
jgi:7,8-dihydro-6-hydroxymethylpterin dimethyltransferase